MNTSYSEVEQLKVRLKYPFYFAEVNTAVFRAWFEAQPWKLRRLARSEKAEDAIMLLDAFHGLPINSQSDRFEITACVLFYLLYVGGSIALMCLLFYGFANFISGAGSMALPTVAVCALVVLLMLFRVSR